MINHVSAKITATTIAFLLAGGAAASYAAVVPQTGPTAGGTEVTVGVPSFTEVDTGESHTVALGVDGKLYSWGRNYDGALGLEGETLASTPTLIPIPGDPTFEHVYTGYNTTFAVDTEGILWGWGANSHGQLGNGQTSNSELPTKVNWPAGLEIVDMALGGSNTFAVDSTGAVWSWGTKPFDSSGTGGNNTSPVRVNELDSYKIAEIEVGGGFYSALTSDGRVVSWGSSNHGTLGHSKPNGEGNPAFVSMPDGIEIVDLESGGGGTLALDSEGNVWFWGDNTGRLAGFASQSAFYESAFISVPKSADPYVDLEVGSDGNAIAVTESGKVQAWGGNDFGVSGTGSRDYWVVAPTDVKIPEGVTFTDVYPGGGGTVALADNGTTYVWGQTMLIGNGTSEYNDWTTTPVPLDFAATDITGVTIGGLPVTVKDDNGASQVVLSPAGLCGPTDVAIQYTFNGKAFEEISKDAFVAGTAPIIAEQPESADVVQGEAFTATFTQNADPAGDVTWEQSANGKNGWTTVPGATSETLTVPDAQKSSFYRAVTENCNGSATTDAVKMTVALKGQPGVDGSDGQDGKDGVNGLDGQNGKDGTDGTDGKNGPAGANGTDGANGNNGADGKDGVDGMDGVTPPTGTSTTSKGVLGDEVTATGTKGATTDGSGSPTSSSAPAQQGNLAKTGADYVVAGVLVGALALLAGLALKYTAKRKS